MRRQEKSSAAAPARDPILQRYEAQFHALRAQLAELGFFCKGTVLERWMTCGKPTCACRTEPARRHGPYFEWTYKEAAKTVNVRLTPEAVAAYRAGTAEWRRLRRLLTRLESLSRRALSRQARA
ncbi:MAG: DUF6788 family protein [Candidatus Rokuibacteriota bacterium]